MRTLLVKCAILRKQTAHPPRRVIPLESNPLTRWSSKLHSWETHLPSSSSSSLVSVGLEGCQCGFNATNAIRTCFYFNTTYPPVFMSATSWDDITLLQRRTVSNIVNNTTNISSAANIQTTENSQSKYVEIENSLYKEKISICEISSDNYKKNADCINSKQRNESQIEANLAWFGEKTFFEEANIESPLLILENFTHRSVNIFTTRLPSNARIVIGHENKGVSKELIGECTNCSSTSEEHSSFNKKSFVIYIPQYGTISSLNVVTTLGIALFYVFLDYHFPNSRVLISTEQRFRKKPEENLEQHNEARSLKASTNELNYITKMNVSEIATLTSNNKNINDNCINHEDIIETVPKKKENDVAICELRHKLRAYQQYFEAQLPTNNNTHQCHSVAELENDHVECTIRRPEQNKDKVDKRPIHPAYYCKSSEEIKLAHKAFRYNLLKLSTLSNLTEIENCSSISTLQTSSEQDMRANGMESNDKELQQLLVANNAVQHNASKQQFGLSVLYENNYDQRNFGGLIRCANAFLVDHVMYLGRKKFNVVGSLGCYHYTPPIHIDLDYTKDDKSKLQLWSEVQKLCGVDCQLWFLDCGQEVLYYDRPLLQEINESYYSSTESLKWYSDHVTNRNYNDSEVEANVYESDFVISLCGEEHVIRNAAVRTVQKCNNLSNHKNNNIDRSVNVDKKTIDNNDNDDHNTVKPNVVLLIPQEGKLPHINLLSQCERVLTILPTNQCQKWNTFRHCTPGLSSQVASGIALQRLSAIFHPSLKVIEAND